MILGIDYGKSTIGLATGDLDSGLAFAYSSVASDESSVDKILDVIKKEGIEKIIVGVPYRLSGDSAKGDTETAVDAFLSELKAATKLPVETEDERMTTTYADKIRKDAGVRAKNFDPDSSAAALILQSYLDRNRTSDVIPEHLLDD